jgi:hypothetical protein
MEEPETTMGLAETEQSPVSGDGGKKKMMRNLAIAIYGVMIFVIVSLNLLIIIGIARGRLIQRTKVNVYLLSLVISRVFIAVFVLPAQITARFSEAYIITSLCKLCHFTAMGSSAVSVMSTAAIAIIKYREFIVHSGRMNLSTKVVTRDLVVIWVLGHVYSVRAAIFNDLFYDVGLEMWRCGITPEYTIIDSYFIFVDLTCMFVVPLFIVGVCYLKRIKHLNDSKAHAKTVKKRPTSGSSSTVSVISSDHFLDPQMVTTAHASDPDVIRIRNVKSIQMIVIVVSLFTICSVAPLALNLHQFFAEPFAQYPVVELTFFIISYSNAWLNALVILAFRHDVRRGLTSKPEQIDPAVSALSSRDALLRTD